MRSPEQHLDYLRSLFAAAGFERGSQQVLLGDAAGRITATDIFARADSPRFDNSQMDGYAVPGTALGGTQLSAGPTVAAGDDPSAAYPEGLGGQAAPIMTGAKIPAGTAAIVPVEACEPEAFVDARQTIGVPATERGSFIRLAGSDIRAGDLLIPSGTVLNPAALATLAGQRFQEVEVYRQARILICTGGAEIGSNSSTSIPDSNGPLLAAAAQRYGLKVAGHVRTDDDPGALRAELQSGIAKHRPDAVVTSGGISAGKFEVVRQVLAAADPQAWFGHVDQQPGGPAGGGFFAGVPVICLPGNPVSTLVSFRLYIATTLGAIGTPPAPGAFAPHPAALEQKAQGLDGREQFLRGVRSFQEGRVSVRPLGGAGSHLIAQAIGADCLFRIPAGACLSAGETVTVYPL